jgi:hypothetical protein
MKMSSTKAFILLAVAAAAVLPASADHYFYCNGVSDLWTCADGDEVGTECNICTRPGECEFVPTPDCSGAAEREAQGYRLAGQSQFCPKGSALPFYGSDGYYWPECVSNRRVLQGPKQPLDVHAEGGAGG